MAVRDHDQLTLTDHLAKVTASTSRQRWPVPPLGVSSARGPVLRRSVQIDPALHHRLRVAAAHDGVPASVVARAAIDRLLDAGTTPDRSSRHDTARRAGRLSITAPVWWWARFRTAAAEADLPQHELVHAALGAHLRS